MRKINNILLIIDSSIIMLIPLLFLYNSNSEYLYLPHIFFIGFILILINLIYYSTIKFVFKSNLYAFVSCLIFSIFLYSHNFIYNALARYGYSQTMLLLILFFITYIITFVIYKIIGNNINHIKFQILSTVFALVLFGLNVYPILKNSSFAEDKNSFKFTYKSEFNVDNQLPSPNVYWIFCDGMLGFDAMENYFNIKQNKLVNSLQERGFVINKDAWIETGHLTRIAIPSLMCPDYYDLYMAENLSSYESAMKYREITDTKLYNSRLNNETIKAFDEKGYTTITISVDDKFFPPVSDYFYYIEAQYTYPKHYNKIPRLVKLTNKNNITQTRNRMLFNQLGNIFLGGLPSIIYDKLINNEELVSQQLKTRFDNTSEVLLNSKDASVNSALVNSVYDSLYSKEFSKPKFVLIHDLMAHRPFLLDKYGNIVKDNDINNILLYPGHYEYATKVLINLVDMILSVDKDAVIILQADHGLHMQTREQIIQGLGNEEAVIDIWNSVFSAIRIPREYDNGDIQFAIDDPRNISRYIINSYIGNNYNYIKSD